MKAIRYDRYGSADVLRLEDVEPPVAADDGLVVRVRAASVNAVDWHFLTGLPYVGRFQFGFPKPKPDGLGTDLAGEVEAVGKDVTRFRPGDEVFGQVDEGRRGMIDLGSFAELVRVSETSVVPMPVNATFEQAAAVPVAGLTALQGLRDQGRIQAGQHVLINGASGGVGTFAVQIARSFGAEVTGVCSTAKVDMVRSLGADHVVDYTREDFAAGGRRYDLILDNVGNRTLRSYRSVLTPEGTYVASFGQPEHRWLGPGLFLGRMLITARFVSQRLITWVTKPNPADLLAMKDLLEAGEVTPAIDRTYKLAEVPDAFRYFDEGHARGKIVITV